MIFQDLRYHKHGFVRAFFMRFGDGEKNDGKQKQPINPFRNFAAKVSRHAVVTEPVEVPRVPRQLNN